MITDSNSKLPSDSTPLDRDLLLAENDRLRALLQDQLELRGSKWIRMLAAARRTGALRWLRRLANRGDGHEGQWAWSWARADGPDFTGVCDLHEQDAFFERLANERPEAIAIVNPHWRGVRSSADNLFDCRLYIDRLNEAAAIRLAQRLADAHVANVVLHGLPLTHDRIVRALHRYSPATRLFVVWHGNFMQLGESDDWHGLRAVLEWARADVIEKVGFIKPGMAEVFARRGLHTMHLLNYVRRTPNAPSLPMENGPHLGLWAVEPIWRKLPYTMIAASALVPGATLWAAGQNKRTAELADLVGVRYRTLTDGPLPQAEMPVALAQMHINLYVTLSECAPMLPLESLAAGVPCLVGPSAQYFDDEPILRNSLMVAAPDDAQAIHAALAHALDNRPRIIDTYKLFAQRYNNLARTRLSQFIASS